MMTDIDHFKSINDRFGHTIGDNVISAVAKVLDSSIRKFDLLCRYGGEEFCIVLPGISIDQACELADRLRDRVESECGQAIHSIPGLRVTACVRDCTSTIEQLVHESDQALYAAKRGGRNRVCQFSATEKRATGSVPRIELCADD
jgi:diguanylate cyclase (GGDEF)-like protein